MDTTDSSQLTGYELSRDWFDFCFDNPELISTTHSALYFFILEHRSRMGQKDKFGFPRRMAMDALAIKSQKTYSQAFEDLASWGFIKVLQESKNQWSANIIQVVKSRQKGTGALKKASNKHAQKHTETGNFAMVKNTTAPTTAPTTALAEASPEQAECYSKKYHSTSQSTSSGTSPIINTKILKDLNTLNTKETWRDSFGIYLKQMSEEFDRIKQDQEFITKQQKYHPGIDILLSIEKAIENYWSTEKAWTKKKRSKTEEIDWRATFKNAIDMNKVYYPKTNGQARVGQILQPETDQKKETILSKFK